MQIRKAAFKCSSERITQVPKDALPDIAFIGRSNVGKSSLINMLTGRPGLAKVSGTPGKTRLINHFTVDDAWYLVDLPGYGYARTSKTVRGEFSRLITDYVLRCEKMHYLFVLVDIRLEPQRIDLKFIEMLGEHGVPFGIVFTKADKLSKVQRQKSVERYQATLSEQWEELPPMVVTSSERGAGRDELLTLIGEVLAQPAAAAETDIAPKNRPETPAAAPDDPVAAMESPAEDAPTAEAQTPAGCPPHV